MKKKGISIGASFRVKKAADGTITIVKGEKHLDASTRLQRRAQAKKPRLVSKAKAGRT